MQMEYLMFFHQVFNYFNFCERGKFMIESRSKNQIVVRGYNKSVTGSTIKCSIERSFYDKFHFLVDYGFYQGAEYKNLEYNDQKNIFEIIKQNFSMRLTIYGLK